MNRRNFLRSAAAASIGATGGIVIASTSAQEILSTGKTILTADDIKTEGKIITTAEYIDEVVDLSKFGDNLAEILANSAGPLTFYPEQYPGGGTKRYWRVSGDITKDVQFKQDGNYVVQHMNGFNRVGMRRS